MATKNGTVDVAAVLAEREGAAKALEAKDAEAISALQSRLVELDGESEKLDAEAATLRAQIKELGGTITKRKSASAPRKRRNEVSLRVAVAQAVAGASGPVALTTVCEAVAASGYKTKAANLSTMVSQNLGILCGLKVGNSPVVCRSGSQRNYEYRAGSGMKRYLANPDSAAAPEAE